jgi:hypothetical protein
MSDYRLHMICCTDTICDEVADKRIKRKDVALSYAFALLSAAAKADSPDWGTINRAILARWSMSGLEWIKKRAIDIASGKIEPCNT